MEDGRIENLLAEMRPEQVGWVMGDSCMMKMEKAPCDGKYCFGFRVAESNVAMISKALDRFVIYFVCRNGMENEKISIARWELSL